MEILEQIEELQKMVMSHIVELEEENEQLRQEILEAFDRGINASCDSIAWHYGFERSGDLYADINNHFAQQREGDYVCSDSEPDPARVEVNLDARIRELEKRLGATERELERWKQGTQVEGDYV